jgi:hypothetical protein
VRVVGNSHSYLFVRGLRNGTVSSSEDVVLNGRMGSDYRIRVRDEADVA